MKRRARAAGPSAGQALFVKTDHSGVEWADTVTAGTARDRTWSADLTVAKAAALASRCVRVTAASADDGKYAKYTGSGFVLARADEDVAVDAGGASQGAAGARGIAPAGAIGTSAHGAAGAADAAGAIGTSAQGAAGLAGTSAHGAEGSSGVVVGGQSGAAGHAGPVRAALAAKLLADASLATSSGLFAPRAADGAMPSFHAITASPYALSVSGTLLGYGVASRATSLSWDVHVLVGGAYVLVDQRRTQACPADTYREYALAATPPECTEFRITLTGIAGTAQALVSVLAFT
jgi:hypothetical protein